MRTNKGAGTRGIKKIVVVAIIATSLLLLGQAAGPAMAAKFEGDENPNGTRITLQDLGALQLAAHDLYSVNRQTETDSEDERLNLSTLFGHGEDNIINGGERRNSENIATRTVAVNLGTYYADLVEDGMDEDEAKSKTLDRYYDQLEAAFKHAFRQGFPKPTSEDLDEGSNRLNGDLALRTVHGFLPGEIRIGNEKMSIFDPSLRDEMLSKKELKQLSRPLDDSFDPAFRNIVVGTDSNGDPITIDLFEKDSTFASQFDTDFTFEELMSDLANGRYDRSDTVMELIKADFAEGQDLD